LHRLGRTGRAGKAGQGVLVLVDLELDYLQQDLAGLNVEPNHRLQGILDGGAPPSLQDDLMRIQYEMRTGQADELNESAVDAYQSILGYYSTRLRSLGVRSSDLLAELVNAFASQAGLVELPVVSERVARQCGLLGNNRIRVDARWTPGSLFQVTDKPPKPKRR
jgi:ATP-dependent RNA helicase MSS116, mitochondrial